MAEFLHICGHYNLLQYMLAVLLFCCRKNQHFIKFRAAKRLGEVQDLNNLARRNSMASNTCGQVNLNCINSFNEKHLFQNR